ncbi:hypothetical protein HYZ97_04900 [Candidatus Pacearchaeota archaeon]|nr:hypothetical protein [Candidatus Pacearchaeota archaeon]
MAQESENYVEGNKKGVAQDIGFTLGGIAFGAGVLGIVLFVLNYFNIVSLSTLSPSLSFLPHRSPTQLPPPSPTQSTSPTRGNAVFTPSLNPESQKGSLIDSYNVFYTLVGKVTAISPSAAQSGKYTIEVTSRDGSQVYRMTEVGGPDIVKSSTGNRKMEFKEIRQGDDVLVDVSVTPSKTSPEPKIFLSQITILSR